MIEVRLTHEQAMDLQKRVRVQARKARWMIERLQEKATACERLDLDLLEKGIDTAPIHED